jgi:hypothetical protein
MVHVPLTFLWERCEFPSASCLAGKKNLKTPRVSIFLKSRASYGMFPFGLCNRKRLVIRHINSINRSFEWNYWFRPTTRGIWSG